jgi:type II secretory pathway pseudopilin PulG
MNQAVSISRRQPSEEGFTMLAVIFLLAILTLWLAVALPKVRQNLQRDREEEAMHRGKQYIRAVQLYYRKFHTYPPSLQALEDTNGIRFLRKDYIDPITGKNDWQPILFGENKFPTAMGFFGQTLTGTTMAGIGPGGAGVGGSGGVGSGLGPNSSASGGAFGGQMFGGLSNSGSEAGSSFGANGDFGTNPTSSNSNTSGGQTFGGAGVIGVSIPSEKQSLLVYKQQDHYNQWEFVYDPIQDRATSMMSGGAGNANGLGAASSLNGGTGTTGGLPGNGTPTNFPSSPNGNLPEPGAPGQNGNGAQPIGPGSPNGNLPTVPQQ